MTGVQTGHRGSFPQPKACRHSYETEVYTYPQTNSYSIYFKTGILYSN